MRIAVCISGRSRITDVRRKVEFLLTTVPMKLRSHGIEPVCSINWAHEPQPPDAAFMDYLRQRGLVSHSSWTPTFLGVGEVMFDTIFTAFQATAQESVEFAVHLPTDSELDVNLPNSVLDNLDKLIQPLGSSSPPDLVIGDYTPLDKRSREEDSIKTGIETHVRALMKYFFPNEWPALENVRRPRSEFFVVHRRFFEHLTTANALWSVFDPMVIALIEAERKPEWRWMPVDLGNFYEDQRRDERAIIRQIHRTTYVLSSYWLQSTNSTGLAAHLAARLPEVIAIEQGSLGSVQKWISA